MTTMTTTTARWTLCRARRQDAGIRLYCFPHSGGSPGEYLRWADQLPDAEVWGVQLPGHGSRVHEPALTDMADLVEAIVANIEFESPFAFFGHSLGSLVAYETARVLRERGLPGPTRLFVSAAKPPHLHRPGPPLHGLSTEELLAAVERTYGALPSVIRDDPETCELVLSGLRADLRIVATYQHQPSARLDCPIEVFGGRADDERLDELAQWLLHTTDTCRLRMFAGDHFYFREQPDEFLAALAGSLAQRAH